MLFIKYIFLNLWRKKKQTLFSALCILVSALIVLANIAMVNGMKAKLKEGINEVFSGRLTVYCSNNPKMNILESNLNEQIAFPWSNADRQELQEIVPDVSLLKRIRLGSLAAYDEETTWLNIQALEKEHLTKINTMLTFSEGGMATRKNELILSERRAKDLGCGVGDTLLLVANNIYDFMSDAVAVVSGTFKEKGLATFLSFNGFVVYEFGEEIAGTDENTCVEFILNPVTQRDFTDEENEAIHQWFATNHAELSLATWEETVPLLSTIVAVWSGGGAITKLVFIAFSLIVLITLTSLIVHSRRKEYGTMLSIGFSWNRIRLLACLEYLLITVTAVTGGYCLLLFLLQQLGVTGIVISSEEMQSALMTDRLYPFLFVKDILYVLFLFSLTSAAAVLISIRKLSRTRITSLLKN